MNKGIFHNEYQFIFFPLDLETVQNIWCLVRHQFHIVWSYQETVKILPSKNLRGILESYISKSIAAKDVKGEKYIFLKYNFCFVRSIYSFIFSDI